VLPLDVLSRTRLKANAPWHEVPVQQVEDDEMILDIGRHSIEQVCS
jgi:3-phosphoglycerate kinase